MRVAMGSCSGESWPKTVRDLNSSVLNKMPRDHTEPYVNTMYGPCHVEGSHTDMKKSLNLSDLVGKRQLTPDGARWLTLATDPFHDWNVPIAGYPDADCSNTVVQCFQYQQDLAAPGAVNWDTHICVNPFVSGASDLEFKQFSDGVPQMTATTDGTLAGILKIRSVTSGQLLAPNNTATYNPAGSSFTTLGSYTDLVKSCNRIIGLGFEVINTSAEIYKQGTVTCYKMPQSFTTSYLRYLNVNGDGQSAFPAILLREAPSTPAIASNLHGTVSWEASKGAYVVCTQQSVNNDITGTTYSPSLRSTTGDLLSGEYSHGSNVAITAATPVNGTTTVGKLFPFNIHGVMVTGLNANSTLRVRLRVYVERAPSCGTEDQSLAVLATPSAPFDAAALKVYSEVCGKMPVGVPVEMNSFGDWWKVISGIIKGVAIPIGTALGGPAGAAIGAGVASATLPVDAVFHPRPDPEGRGPVAESENFGSNDGPKKMRKADKTNKKNGKKQPKRNKKRVMLKR